MESRGANPAPATAARVEAELVRLGYHDLPLGLATTFLVAVGLAWVVAEGHVYREGWLWLAVMGVFTAARTVTILLYHRRPQTAENYRPWKLLFTAGSSLSAMGWAYAAWVFYPIMGDVELSLLIMVIAGMTAGATRSLGAVFSACVIFQFATLAPLILRALTSEQPAQSVMGGLSIVYLAFLFAMARSYHRSLSDSLRLGFESAMLADELKERQRQAEVLNRELRAEVSHRREIEIELRAAKERAESANLAKGEFLATMSHEIRTPMNGILGMLDLLNTAALTPGQREQVETAANSADSLLRILNDILDFSKIESGRLDFESIPFRPGAVAEDIVSLLRARAAAKSLELTLSVNDTARTRVMGDPTRFRQVLLNLIGNAVKFSDRGLVEVALVGTPRDPEHIELQVIVRDHGIGMSPETIATLFQPFTQADSSMSRKYGGSGLGLAIAQRLVQGMGGLIRVESAPGEGSKFEFALPFNVARDRNTPPGLADSGNLPRLFAGRILVVEDDEINQRVISLMLKRLGLECHVVPDGQAGLDALASAEWDLVLMDLQLPGIDGLETTRRARLLLGKKKLPIVALTANARPEDRAACLAAGMDDFLTKPVRSEVLHACLLRWLQPVR